MHDIMPTAREIIVELGDGWSAVRPEHHDNGVYLHGPDDVRIQIAHTPSWKGSGDRYVINGRPSQEESQQSLGYSESKDHARARQGITVAASKSPAQIARDITNRLLPAYLPYLAALRKRLNAHNDHESRVATLRDELLTVLGNAGSALNEHDIYLHLEDGYGTIRVNADSVSFDRLSVPAHLALGIANVLTGGTRNGS